MTVASPSMGETRWVLQSPHMRVFVPVVLDLDTARSMGHHRFMTLAEALQRAEDEYVDNPEPESLIIAEQEVIAGSSPCGYIIGVNAETIPAVGIMGALECAVVMGIRFGMCTQRMLEPARQLQGRAKRKNIRYDS
jgi:hypothetical protein